MATPLFAGNRAAQQALREAYIRNRWQTPFVTDVRMTKQTAHALAFAQLRARMEMQRRAMQQR